MRDKFFISIDISFDRKKPFEVVLDLRASPGERGTLPVRVDAWFVREVDKRADDPEIALLTGADGLIPEEGAEEIARSLPEEARARPFCPGTVAVILEEIERWHHRELLQMNASLEPYTAEEFNNRGCARFGLGDVEGALSDYNTAIAMAPSDPTYRLNRARLLIEMGRNEEAVTDLDETYSLVKDDITPFSAVHLLNIARCYSLCNLRERAEKAARLFARRLKKFCPTYTSQVGGNIVVSALGYRLLLPRDEVEEVLGLVKGSEVL